MRAYGLLLHDLVARLKWSEHIAQSEQDDFELLQEIVKLCIGISADALQRPSFSILLYKILMTAT